MKKTIRRLVTLCLLAGALVLALPRENVKAATNTSGSFEERIVQLQGKFPAGKYWNHMGSNTNNPNGYTSTPCTHHGHCRIRWNVTINKSNITGFSYVQHANNYNDIMSISSDRTNPVISNARIESVDAGGYTISANVSDNVGVASVSCATWTSANGQDDLLWKTMSVNGNTARLYVRFSDHGNEVSYYNNHIYVYDAAGNAAAIAADYNRCENIGTNFYAKITNPELNRVITNKNGNAVSCLDQTAADRLWKFERQPDNSYKIISCLDGSVLDVNKSGTAEGTNVQIWNWEYQNGAQIFRFDKISDVSGYGASMEIPKFYNRESLTNECKEFTEGDTLYFQVECKNAVQFHIRIYRNDQVIFENTVAPGRYKYPNLSEGNYRVEFTPINDITSSRQAVIKTFEVKKKQVTPKPQEPSRKVADFRVKAAKTNSITLSWSKVQKASGYEIYRYTGNSWKVSRKITVSGGNTISWTDKKLKGAAVYKYKIRPYFVENKKKIYGDFSDMLTANTTISAPRMQLVKIKYLRQVHLVWNKVKGASGYEVYRSSSKNGAYQKIASVTKNKAVNRYADKKLQTKACYYYKLRAYKVVAGKKIYSSFTAVKAAKM